RLARDRAVITATPHVLTVSDAGDALIVQPAAAPWNAAGPADPPVPEPRTFNLPRDVTASATDFAGVGVAELRFHPDGASDVGVLHLTTPQGDAVELVSETAGRGFVPRGGRS